MKRNISTFLAGALSALLVGSLAVSALATAGALTLNVTPIQVLVNGETFHPKDANGEDALVFVYEGTTYAPLRALAETYGLEVGYNAEQNLATITGTAQKSEDDSVSSQWAVTEKPTTRNGGEQVFTATYTGGLGMSGFKAWWNAFSEKSLANAAEQMAAALREQMPGSTVTVYFDYDGYALGTAYAFEGITQSNFQATDIWVK